MSDFSFLTLRKGDSFQKTQKSYKICNICKLVQYCNQNYDYECIETHNFIFNNLVLFRRVKNEL